MEASALTHASHRGLLARRSPLLKLQGDERLIAMARNGNPGAFETIVDRYQGRLLGFCRQMLGSTEDAEDVLQEVFVNAYRAMLADEREINLRPWLYRIARNRCLNHLRKPTADAQESMDMVPMVEAASTAEKVHNREEFRQLLSDVGKLPETQRSALLLREMDAMSYEEIAQAMETSVPSVKSLLVRARISLAEASQARQLTCGEVRIELAEAAEGLRKVSGPVRRHVRDCEECSDFRSQVRSNDKALAALFPAGPLLAFKGFLLSKLGLGGAGGAGAAPERATAGAGASATAPARSARSAPRSAAAARPVGSAPSAARSAPRPSPASSPPPCSRPARSRSRNRTSAPAATPNPSAHARRRRTASTNPRRRRAERTRAAGPGTEHGDRPEPPPPAEPPAAKDPAAEAAPPECTAAEPARGSHAAGDGGDGSDAPDAWATEAKQPTGAAGARRRRNGGRHGRQRTRPAAARSAPPAPAESPPPPPPNRRANRRRPTAESSVATAL